MNKDIKLSPLAQDLLDSFIIGANRAIAEHQKWLAEQGENTNTPKIANGK